MKILIVTSEAPPIVSGISRCVGELADGLRHRGHVVDIISSTDIPRVKLDEYRFSAMAAYWPGIARRLRDYDLVNLHGPVPTLSDVFLLFSRLLRRGACPPIVYTHHCAIEIGKLDRACRAYNKMHIALSSFADTVVASSTWYAQPLTSAEGGTVEVIPWGVDARGALQAEKGSGPLRVLFVGQMRPYKGVEVLLEATATLPEVELTLVGNGGHLREYQQAARDRGAVNVKFLGRLPDDMLRAEYAASDVIVLPSTTHAEAFGLVVLEGMASGCVPVVSNLPGVRDLADGTGLVVPSGDPYELRRALAFLAADRERLTRMQAQARARAVELSWTRCVDRYEEVFRTVARRGAPTRDLPAAVVAERVPEPAAPGR